MKKGINYPQSFRQCEIAIVKESLGFNLKIASNRINQDTRQINKVSDTKRESTKEAILNLKIDIDKNKYSKKNFRGIFKIDDEAFLNQVIDGNIYE